MKHKVRHQSEFPPEECAIVQATVTYALRHGDADVRKYLKSIIISRGTAPGQKALSQTIRRRAEAKFARLCEKYSEDLRTKFVQLLLDDTQALQKELKKENLARSRSRKKLKK